jgi:hypothetical protein
LSGPPYNRKFAPQTTSRPSQVLGDNDPRLRRGRAKVTDRQVSFPLELIDGRITLKLDPKGPFFYTPQGNLALRVADGLIVSPSSPYAVRLLFDPSMILDENGRVGAFPPFENVRNDTTVLESRNLHDAIVDVEIEQRRFRDVALGYPSLDSRGVVVSLRGGQSDSIATLDAFVLVPTAQLGTGVASAATVLIGDRTWGAVPAGALGPYTSAEIAAMVSDETGTGLLVFATSPTLTTPRITTALHDPAGQAILDLTGVGSAVNRLRVRNSATGTAVLVGTDGSDADIDVNFSTTGSGEFQVDGDRILTVADNPVLDGDAAGGDLTGTYPNPTIANDAVTYAKLQNISATDRLLGRDTAAAGNAEELTVSGGVEFTGSGGIQRSALTGDVTASAGSNSTTVVSASTSTAGKVELATDGEETAGLAVQGSDSRLIRLISRSESIVSSTLPSAGTGLLLTADTAYFIYLGRTTRTETWDYVRFAVRSAAIGAQTAEVGFFSTPAAPARANQTVTKIAATGTVDDLTVTGPRANTNAFAQSIAAGTHVWAGIRTNMAATQPSIYGLFGDLGHGRILLTATAGVLTSGTTWTGAVPTDAGINIGPSLSGALD